MNLVQLNSGFTLFLSLLVEAFPFLLLGVLFSGLLQFFVDERKLVQWMPRGAFLGALFGSCIGFLFPVCECGNVPVARRLLMQGAPSSVAIGFLLAAPTINPIVFWATWTAFRDQPEIAFLRIGCSLVIATLIGWVFSFQRDMRPLLQPAVALAMPIKSREPKAAKGAKNQSAAPLIQSGTYFLGQSTQPVDLAEFQQAAAAAIADKPLSYKLNLMLDAMLQEIRELGGVLILGSAIAAAVQVFIPREAVVALGQGPVSSIVAMMLLAAIVSICSTVDAFFALSFSSTFTTGSLLAFLVFGPMIDLKGIGLMLAIFKPRAVFYLFALAGSLTFLFALFINLYVS